MSAQYLFIISSEFRRSQAKSSSPSSSSHSIGRFRTSGNQRPARMTPNTPLDMKICQIQGE
ncbi:MAG: hypothetical protein JRG86_02930 [Deltaproteobacteria bacterium]|jgi:hypothetical protein|nr:hypothetical protein [Deltaproteobacteria bacterium]MBW2497745.1 hypothetical protein [Deltaproteobacteria bacterium]